MRKDSQRLDLDADLDKVAGDFLKDVEAATKEVKQRKEADAEKDRRSAVKQKDRKISLIVIAVATVVLILVAYMVFARPPAQQAGAVTTPTQANPPVVATGQANGRRQAPRLTPQPGQNRQQPQQPPNEYEPPPM